MSYSFARRAPRRRPLGQWSEGTRQDVATVAQAVSSGVSAIIAAAQGQQTPPPPSFPILPSQYLTPPAPLPDNSWMLPAAVVGVAVFGGLAFMATRRRITANRRRGRRSRRVRRNARRRSSKRRSSSTGFAGYAKHRIGLPGTGGWHATITRKQDARGGFYLTAAHRTEHEKLYGVFNSYDAAAHAANRQFGTNFSQRHMVANGTPEQHFKTYQKIIDDWARWSSTGTSEVISARFKTAAVHERVWFPKSWLTAGDIAREQALDNDSEMWQPMAANRRRVRRNGDDPVFFARMTEAWKLYESKDYAGAKRIAATLRAVTPAERKSIGGLLTALMTVTGYSTRSSVRGPSRRSREWMERNITPRQRARLPESAFVFPKRRSWPINNARRAYAATQFLRMGRVGSASDFNEIRNVIRRRYPKVWDIYGRNLTWDRAKAAKSRRSRSRGSRPAQRVAANGKLSVLHRGSVRSKRHSVGVPREAWKGQWRFKKNPYHPMKAGTELTMWEAISLATQQPATSQGAWAVLSPAAKAKIKALPDGFYSYGVGKKGPALRTFHSQNLSGLAMSTRIAASKSHEPHWLIAVQGRHPVVVRMFDDRGKTVYRVEEFVQQVGQRVHVSKKRSASAY